MESEKKVIRIGVESDLDEDEVLEILRDLAEFDLAVVRKPVAGNPQEIAATIEESGLDALLLPLENSLAERPDTCLGLALPGIDWFVPRSALENKGHGSRVDRPRPPALFFARGHALLSLVREFYVASVAFVGGGPGDPGLCTVAGIEALRYCDVCLYDALVPESLLTELPLGSRPVYVGKRCGRHSHGQGEICELLADYARLGLRVVRLKGGDPGIFGRLAEEIDIFDRFSLPCRVVPGVSSLLAATTGTGMFLTRRNISRGFTVLTPRHAVGGAEDPVYGVENGTLPPRPVVFFMAMGKIGALTKTLQRRGRKADEPAAVVWGASTPEQKIVRGTLNDIADRVKDYDGDLPGIFMLGVTTSYSLQQGRSALREEAVLLLVKPSRLKACGETVRSFGGRPVVPPPLLELSGVERRKPAFSSVVCSDPEVEMAYARQWGNLPERVVRAGDDGIKLIRDLARDRVRERILVLDEPGPGEGK